MNSLIATRSTRSAWVQEQYAAHSTQSRSSTPSALTPPQDSSNTLTSTETQTSTETHSKVLSDSEFESRLSHLVARGLFNDDHPWRAKGLRQHVKRLLQSCEQERQSHVLFKASIRLQLLKKSLKDKRGNPAECNSS